MKKLLWIMLTGLLLAACTSSRITTWWKAPGSAAQNYHKILVLGFIRSADRSFQHHMEDHLVGDFADLGYNAVSSLQEYGPKALTK
ncbi:MAG: hypothetical protein ACXVJD_10425 [Mucilaginibacter sp.]